MLQCSESPYPSDFTFRVMAMSCGAAMQLFSLANPQNVCNLMFCIVLIRHLPVLPLLNYILTLYMLLHFYNVVTWEFLKRVDGHQIQSKRCSVLLLGRSEWLSTFPFFSSPSHQAFCWTQLRAAFDNRADKLCAAWIENVKDNRAEYQCIHRWHKPISSLSRLFGCAQGWLAWTNSSVYCLKNL